MNNQLEKILNFVKKTGEKGIFFDNDGEFVLMKLDDLYNLSQSSRDFSNLSEEEMLNRINRDIALWREGQKEDEQDGDWEPADTLEEHDLSKEEEGLEKKELMDNDFDFGEDDKKEEDGEYFKEYYKENKAESGVKDGDELEMDDFEMGDLHDDDLEFTADDDSGIKEGAVGKSMNNFGYTNPSDTNGDNAGETEVEEFNESAEDLANFSEIDEENEDGYDIPPPPDIDKN